MSHAKEWMGRGWVLLCSLGVLGALELAKVTPGARQKGFFSQFTSRSQWQMPARVMDEIGVKPGMTVADVGAGDGWFTFYLAERVGSSGRVIAEDIDARALEAVRGRCAQEKVSNVSVLVGETEDPKLPAGAVDLALMVNVLTSMGNTRAFLGNLAKGLKPEGRLVIIDFNPVKYEPEMAEREDNPAVRWILRQIYDADFEVVKILDFLPAQTIWICKQRETGGRSRTSKTPFRGGTLSGGRSVWGAGSAGAPQRAGRPRADQASHKETEEGLVHLPGFSHYAWTDLRNEVPISIHRISKKPWVTVHRKRNKSPIT
jgi:ubiquinone/menaquinone biosynthesis C-methylase UbiE